MGIVMHCEWRIWNDVAALSGPSLSQILCQVEIFSWTTLYFAMLSAYISHAHHYRFRFCAKLRYFLGPPSILLCYRPISHTRIIIATSPLLKVFLKAWHRTQSPGILRSYLATIRDYILWRQYEKCFYRQSVLFVLFSLSIEPRRRYIIHPRSRGEKSSHDECVPDIVEWSTWRI
jgi:hypothetical protein